LHQSRPELVQAHLDRARALVKLGRFGEALPDLKIAEAANPDDPSIHFLLSTVYRNQGNDSEAKVEIQRYGQLQQKATQHAKQCHGDPVKHPVGYCALLNGADEDDPFSSQQSCRRGWSTVFPLDRGIVHPFESSAAWYRYHHRL
jgi:hypothetical protein